MRPPILNPWFADIRSLTGVGDKVADALERAFTVRAPARLRDLLLTPPASLIDRSNRPGIAGAMQGDVATFLITVGRHTPPSTKSRPYRIKVYDDTGEMTLVFFKSYGSTLQRQFPEGAQRLISGKVEIYQAEAQMTHPDYILAPDKADELPTYEPVYPLTAGLSPKVARKSVWSALEKVSLGEALPEWLDPDFIKANEWPGFNEAVLRLHQPDHVVDVSPSAPPLRRLAYDELFAKQLAMALVRERNRAMKGEALAAKGEYVQDVLGGSPFPPTGAQSRAFEEIKADMQSPSRMARLLQGDVGAGKTFVAALAAAYACEAGAQVAVMAPTEILARQHADTLSQMLDPAGLTVEALTGRDKGGQRKAINTGLAQGHIDVVVGTHALFQDGVEFGRLGLVVIDEQHRFGVRDRLRLTEKGDAPDLLVMTATPIPRTLALTSYGDLDISILDEKPAGRQPIQTVALPLQRMDDVIDAIGRAVEAGDQAYWVCPLVEDSDVSDLGSAEDRHRQLTAIFGEKVGLLHGRMNALEKESVSRAFKAGRYDILVATTVIEVGVDAPNATVMVIEHAERFGLAQLHQLRGRVGRGDKASSCILLYKNPLSQNGKERLNILRESEDGFLIAEKDWELRGSGDLLGAAQSGLPRFRLANLDKHRDLLETATQDARLLVERDPALTSERGQAARVLLYLFEQDHGIAMMRAG
ncbi:ATP-dependent DNA helicase RecG [uncultured Algimonas sp.]|uniref:ATP-dependent DNA helicase RecG n=1 Tax=uncultured Algimonas sp. TaxID=1547920 RepID=UPI0026057A7C|nr:ATP-dependent DNA helicase RecG [uncultured Algimonas sp.]